jgi:hypothetical protein
MSIFGLFCYYCYSLFSPTLIGTVYRIFSGRLIIKKTFTNQALVAHPCNPSYSGGRDQEDHGSKTTQANTL